ncbi:conserved hypothetical protein [Tenacibaculum ascidiaceicola]
MKYFMMFSALEPEPEAKITMRFMLKFSCFVTTKKRIIINNGGVCSKIFRYFFYFRHHIFEQKLELIAKICIFASILNFKTNKLCQTLHQE